MDFFLKTGIGQDSHRFLPEDSAKPCIIAGAIFEGEPGFKSSSDGDVVYRSLCNAITSITGVPILSGIADELCLKVGITDSQVYLEEAMKTLQQWRISHVAISLEGKRPLFKARIEEMRRNVARTLHLDIAQVGITAISGEGLSDVGCGEGVQALSIITAVLGRS